MVGFAQQFANVVLVSEFGVKGNPKIFDLVCQSHVCVKNLYCRRSGGEVSLPFGKKYNGTFTDVNLNSPFFEPRF
jgi:hypothetical protein